MDGRSPITAPLAGQRGFAAARIALFFLVAFVAYSVFSRISGGHKFTDAMKSTPFFGKRDSSKVNASGVEFSTGNDGKHISTDNYYRDYGKKP
jgi:hypothetical protein